jgi:UDPglucose--hexose-1-phosphate uridylyltransferase
MPTDPVASRSAIAHLAGEPHRRYDPLSDEWVLVSAGRTRRPWLGAEEPTPEPASLAYDPDCYLCPGNTRANGDVNPAYAETFVFTNDFSALRPDTSIATFDDGLLRAEGERGSCRVVCFAPQHDLTLGRMGRDAVRRVTPPPGG